jgi:uncharacterized protein (UPF0262 family)
MPLDELGDSTQACRSANRQQITSLMQPGQRGIQTRGRQDLMDMVAMAAFPERSR